MIADAVSSGGSDGEYVVPPSGDGDSWQVEQWWWFVVMVAVKVEVRRK